MSGIAFQRAATLRECHELACKEHGESNIHEWILHSDVGLALFPPSAAADSDDSDDDDDGVEGNADVTLEQKVLASCLTEQMYPQLNLIRANQRCSEPVVPAPVTTMAVSIEGEGEQQLTLPLDQPLVEVHAMICRLLSPPEAELNPEEWRLSAAGLVIFGADADSDDSDDGEGADSALAQTLESVLESATTPTVLRLIRR